MTKPKPIENWEESFVEKFGFIVHKGIQCDEITVENMKQFIRKTLKEEIAKVGEELIGQNEELSALAVFRNPSQTRNLLKDEQRNHLREILKKL